jgi:hypothetical protein
VSVINGDDDAYDYFICYPVSDVFECGVIYLRNILQKGYWTVIFPKSTDCAYISTHLSLFAD